MDKERLALEQLPFVLDEVPYSFRKENRSNLSIELLPRPDKIDVKTLKNVFKYRVGELKPIELKRFLDYQITYSPNPKLLLEYFEYEFLLGLKAKIKSDSARFGIEYEMNSFFVETANKKIEIFSKVIQSGLSTNGKKISQNIEDGLKDFLNELIIYPEDYLFEFKKAVKGLKGKELRTAINILEGYGQLVIPSRSISRLHRALENELANGIGTRQAFDDFYVNGPGSMNNEYQNIFNRLNPLLEKFPIKAPK